MALAKSEWETAHPVAYGVDDRCQWGRAYELHLGEALEHGREGDPGFQTCQLRTQAEVDAYPEADVAVGIAPNVEALGVDELFWIAVGRADPRRYPLARFDGLPV